jgi:hypothetical protein
MDSSRQKANGVHDDVNDGVHDDGNDGLIEHINDGVIEHGNGDSNGLSNIARDGVSMAMINISDISAISGFSGDH